MKAICISISPNTLPADITRAWDVLMHGAWWENEGAVSHAQSMVSEWTGERPVELTSSGRQALFDTLAAFDIGGGDEVILQAFTCTAAVAPILWRRATPVYADIEPNTYNMDPRDVRTKIRPRTKAIIVQHTFGMPAHIEELRDIAREHDLVLIEDCAHALGAMHSNQPLGTFGDAAIYSFGRDKVISSVFGGAIASPHDYVMERVREYAQLRSLPPRSWVRRQLFHPIIAGRAADWYFTASIGKAMLVAGQKLGLLSKAVEAEERSGARPSHIAWRYSPALAYLLEQQLEEFHDALAWRQYAAERYLRELTGTSAQLPPMPSGDATWLRFPIQVDDPAKLFDMAREFNILLGDWYRGPLAPNDCSLDAFGYTPGLCPNAESAAKRVINLPTHPRMSEEDPQRVINLVKRYDRT